jgi:two-component system nitrogen regulation response regulator GlnG
MKDKKLHELYNFDDAFCQFQGEVYKNILAQIEKPLFEWVFKKTKGNQLKSAKILGINRNTLRAKMRRLEIKPEAYK